MVTEKKLISKNARERITLMETPDLSEGVIEGFQSLGDASGIDSDVMDELGITGVLPASTMRPTMPARSLLVAPSPSGTSPSVRTPTRLRKPTQTAWLNSRPTTSPAPAMSW